MPKRSVSKSVDAVVVAFLKKHSPTLVAEWHSTDNYNRFLESFDCKKSTKTSKPGSIGHSPYIWFCITQRKEAKWVKDYNAQDVLREMGRRWQEVKKHPDQLARYIEMSDVSKKLKP